MLRVTFPDVETFSNATNEFYYISGGEVTLEHSLLSISKWEAKHHKYFLNNRELTNPEILDYVRCMTVKGNVDDRIYDYLPVDTLKTIMAYMEDTMTATWFGANNQSRPGPRMRGKVLTSELLYYYMIAFNIPMECEKWHINRLLTLIQVCQAEQNPKKLTGKALAERNSRLNEARRKKFHSNG
jgi:hypothetical protein